MASIASPTSGRMQWLHASVSTSITNRSNWMKQPRLGLLAGLLCPALVLLSVGHSAAPAPADPNAAPAAPPLPSIRSLKLEPASLTLHGARDERRVLVLGMTEGGTFVDLTAQATFQPASSEVALGAPGHLRPTSKGKTE